MCVCENSHSNSLVSSARTKELYGKKGERRKKCNNNSDVCFKIKKRSLTSFCYILRENKK